jgi:hypothetical protein
MIKLVGWVYQMSCENCGEVLNLQMPSPLTEETIKKLEEIFAKHTCVKKESKENG